MDWFPILFNFEMVLFVAALVIWANDKALVRWRRRMICRIRRRRAARREAEQLRTAPVRPRMSAREVVNVCSSLTP